MTFFIEIVWLSLCLFGSVLADYRQQHHPVAVSESCGSLELSEGTCPLSDSLIYCYEDRPGINRTFKGCECNAEFLHCEICTERNESVRATNCVTYDNHTDLIEIGLCLLGHRAVQLDKLQTGSSCDTRFYRAGTLCGRCEEGYYTPSYSFDMTCIRCPNGRSDWWKFILAAFLPLTIFCFVILLLRVNVTSSSLHGFVFYAQTVSMPAVLRVALIATVRERNSISLRVFSSLYSIWNLDFFRSLNHGLCLGTDTLQTLALDFAVGMYPLVLLILAYLLINFHDRNFIPLVILWRPFRIFFSQFNSHWRVRTSVIDAFASFLLLANCKVLSVSFDLLIPVKVYHLDSTGHLTCDYRLFFDATIPYFGKQHLPYAILAIVMLVLIVLLPLLVLSLYPFQWFHKVLNLIPTRWYILHTFVDSFQGCYKDGTEPGTRDCRWFASLFLLVRFLQFVVGTLTLGVRFYAYSTMILLLVVILLVEFQPFKKQLRYHLYTNVLFLLALAMWNVLCLGKASTKAIHGDVHVHFFFLAIVGIAPLVYISVIILHWLFRNRRFGCRFMARFQAWRHGYTAMSD